MDCGGNGRKIVCHSMGMTTFNLEYGKVILESFNVLFILGSFKSMGVHVKCTWVVAWVRLTSNRHVKVILGCFGASHSIGRKTDHSSLLLLSVAGCK